MWTFFRVSNLVCWVCAVLSCSFQTETIINNNNNGNGCTVNLRAKEYLCDERIVENLIKCATLATIPRATKLRRKKKNFVQISIVGIAFVEYI